MNAEDTAAKPTGSNVTFAPKGYAFIKGRGAMLVRLDRSDAERIKMVLMAELLRCGCPTRKLKVREVGDQTPLISDQASASAARTFFVNIWFLRGLDPDALYQILRTLPNKCGVLRVISAIEDLPERVEAASAQGFGAARPNGEEALA
jgi:hypothetical protein